MPKFLSVWLQRRILSNIISYCAHGYLIRWFLRYVALKIIEPIATCGYDPGHVDVGEPVGELVHVDETVEVVPVELVAHLTLDTLVLRPKLIFS